MMEQSQIQGIIPTAFFGLPQLQKVVLKNNKLSGMLDLGASRSSQLQFVDLQNNSITDYTQRPADNSLQIILVGNPVCGTILTEQNHLCFLSQPNPSYLTPRNCEAGPCPSDTASSPSCHCSYPYRGTLTFTAPQFSNLQNFTNFAALERALMTTFFSNKMPVDSVSLSNIYRDTSNYLQITLQIFPHGQARFNRTALLTIGFMFSSQTFKPPSYYGPFTFLADEYTNFSDGSEPDPESKSKSMSLGKILTYTGISVGGLITLVCSIFGARHCYTKNSCSGFCNNWFHFNNNCNNHDNHQQRAIDHTKRPQGKQPPRTYEKMRR